MKKSKVKKLEVVIMRECKKQNIPYNRSMLRQAKKVYVKDVDVRNALVNR